MNILKTIKRAGQSVMWRMTKNIGISHVDPGINLTVKAEIKRVLICRPNHRLGNLLLVTPLLQEVIETFPQAKIDLFVKGRIAPVLLKNYDAIDHIIQLPGKPFKNIFKYLLGWIKLLKRRYDIVINAAYHSSSGRLSAHFAKSKYKCYGDVDESIQLKYKDHEHSAKYPIYSLRNYLERLGFTNVEKEIPSLNLKLSSLEIAEGKKILNNLVNNDKRTICLFTYATRDKCYSEVWWGEFYERLKMEYQQYNIIEVLPVENISQISFKAPAFYSRDIRQIGSLIANTEVFIGADSGMMHLASSVQIPTVGLFKVTNPNIYEPYNNSSVAIDTNNSNIDDCIKIVNRILSKVNLQESAAAS